MLPPAPAQSSLWMRKPIIAQFNCIKITGFFFATLPSFNKPASFSRPMTPSIPQLRHSDFKFTSAKSPWDLHSLLAERYCDTCIDIKWDLGGEIPFRGETESWGHGRSRLPPTGETSSKRLGESCCCANSTEGSTRSLHSSITPAAIWDQRFLTRN